MRKLKDNLQDHKIKEQRLKLDSNNIKLKLKVSFGRLVKNSVILKLNWKKRLKNLHDKTKIIKEMKQLY